MILFKKAEQITNYIAEQKQKGKKIGFVPTMGALHDGHLSLVQACKKENDITACSIFINPTQFNNPDDFTHYPVTIEKDIEKLLEAGVSLLFLPLVSEIYPATHQKKNYDLGYLEEILEGHYRPGHFQGVCEVVDRLLEIVPADRLYLGQKDFQQCMVIRKMVQLTGRENDLQLVICPIIREPDGLAMSSRNLRLTPDQRLAAPVIFEALNFIKSNHHLDRQELIAGATNLLKTQGFHVDYVEIADADTLQPRENINGRMVALVAAATGRIRLIDNMVIDV